MSKSEPKTQTAAERREAEAELRALVARYAPEHSRLFSAVRRWLQKRLPGAHELVYEYRDNFVISYSADDRGYEGVLGLRASADGVKLYLNGAKGVPDPEKLLRGSGSQARWLQVESASVLARPAVARLIDEAIARRNAPFAATGRGPVVIRTTAAKKRRG
ncbi:MAG: hypothetical protein R2862_03340 [Thermoanaerobaculia bacterium]